MRTENYYSVGTKFDMKAGYVNKYEWCSSYENKKITDSDCALQDSRLFQYSCNDLPSGKYIILFFLSI